MSKPSVLERAYELARSGECKGLPDLRKTLRDEGYEKVDSHFNGALLRRELTKIIEDTTGVQLTRRGGAGRFTTVDD